VISAEIATKARLILFETASAQIDDTQDPPLAPDIGWQADFLEQVIGDLPEEYAKRGLVMFTEARTSRTRSAAQTSRRLGDRAPG